VILGNVQSATSRVRFGPMRARNSNAAGPRRIDIGIQLGDCASRYKKCHDHEKYTRRAESIGAVAIDFTKGDPVPQIKDLRAANRSANKLCVLGGKRCPALIVRSTRLGIKLSAKKIRSTKIPCRRFGQVAGLFNPKGPVGLIGVYFDRIQAVWTNTPRKANSFFHWANSGTLSKAVEASAHFDQRGVGKGRNWTKVLLKAGLSAA
jgi:hypothetical protein